MIARTGDFARGPRPFGGKLGHRWPHIQPEQLRSGAGLLALARQLVRLGHLPRAVASLYLVAAAARQADGSPALFSWLLRHPERISEAADAAGRAVAVAAVLAERQAPGETARAIAAAWASRAAPPLDDPSARAESARRAVDRWLAEGGM